MTTPKVPEALDTAVRRGHRFLLTSHVNPDGDAIGSAIGLSRVLRRLGKGATIWNHDATPPGGFPELFDAAIVLECPSPERTGLADRLGQITVINIDHHLGNEHYGAVNWVETAAPAVGEMVFRLSRALNVELDRDAANALYLTLVTDTGGFRFSNTTPETFEAAAALVRAGASPETVSAWIYESNPAAVMRLLGELLATLELHDEGRVATVRITREMMERAGAEPGDSEGLIDYPRSIAGVRAVALFRELDGGEHKVSLRSRGGVNVERIARQHGGGGHHNAAGFSSSAQKDREQLTAETIRALAAAIAEAPEQAAAPEDGETES